MRFRALNYVLFVLITMSTTAIAGLPIIDNFEDGNATDGQPVSWAVGKAPADKGKREVVNGSYVLTPDLNSRIPKYGDYRETDSVVVGVSLQDVSIQATARALSDENDFGIGLFGRETWDGVHGVTVWSALRRDGTLMVGSGKDDDITLTETVATGLDAFTEDVSVRLDIIGDTATAYAWYAAHPTNTPTQVSIQLPGAGSADYMVEGGVGVWNGQFGADLTQSIVPIAFREVQIVPEPAAWSLLAPSLLMFTLRRYRPGSKKNR